MWKQTTKPPAWVSLSDNRLPNLEPASPGETKALQDVLGHGLLIERLMLDGRHLQMYRIKDDSNERACLIKWLPSDQYDEAIENYDLCLWLNQHSFSTPYPVYKPYQMSSNQGGLIYGFSYHHHRLLLPTQADMITLATRMTQLHELLATHKDYPDWKQNTEKRMVSLAKVRDALATGNLRSGPDPERLCKIANDNSLDFIRHDLPRQSLHGDLNFRNAFVPITANRHSNSRLMLLDFEDVKHSVLPVVFELALVIERFILLHEQNDEAAITAGQAFLSEYQSLHSLDLQQIDWVNVIQSLNFRSLCVLSQIEKQGGDIHAQEWQKFFYLFDYAKQQAALWRRIAS